MADDAVSSVRFAQDFLTILRQGQLIHDLSVSDMLTRAGVARGTYYAMLAQAQVPRWPAAVALAAAVGWRMNLLVTPLPHHRTSVKAAASLPGHALPPRPAIADVVQHCVSTMRQHVAAALLMGLSQRGWSLRHAAQVAHLSPTKPNSLLTAECGPDLATLAQFIRPMGYAVTVRYQPWDAPAAANHITPTAAAARRIRSRHASTFAMLTRLSPELSHLAQDPDDDTIRATYARLGSITAAAAALQVSVSWLRPAMQRLDIPVRSYLRGTPATRLARNIQIVHDATGGLTCDQIGQRHGITRSRVQQILHKQRIDVRKLRRQHAAL